MIRVLSLVALVALGSTSDGSDGLVEEAVTRDHVVDDRGLGDLLGAELGGRREVLAVVVAEVVVRGDREGLDTSADEEVGEDGLDLRSGGDVSDVLKGTREEKGRTLVCPDLKSSPPMKLLWCSASSMHPGTNVFWGAPLM